MDRREVQDWLDRYVAAWKSYDPDAIGALFAEDCEYRYHPYDEPVRGSAAIVESWLGGGAELGASSRDPKGTYDARYRVVAVDGEIAVATGWSTYSEVPGGPVVKTFDNCFLMQFDGDGHCSQFTEFFIERPKP